MLAKPVTLLHKQKIAITWSHATSSTQEYQYIIFLHKWLEKYLFIFNVDSGSLCCRLTVRVCIHELDNQVDFLNRKWHCPDKTKHIWCLIIIWVYFLHKITDRLCITGEIVTQVDSALDHLFYIFTVNLAIPVWFALALTEEITVGNSYKIHMNAKGHYMYCDRIFNVTLSYSNWGMQCFLLQACCTEQ